MCGLNYFENKNTDHWKKRNVFPDMQKSISHRGFTEHIVDIGGKSFGHVRLPVIDLSNKSRQPMHNDNWLMLFVGEIYDYKGKWGNCFKSDSLALFDLWQEVGSKLFQHIDGMYSCLFYDKKNDEIHIITHFLNKKPLYCYIDQEEKISAISSEIKSLQQNFFVNRDNIYLQDLYFNRMVSSDRTPWEEIKMFLPNSHYIIKGGRVKQRKDLVHLKPSGGDIRDALIKSVNNRLNSDIPVSVLLSGGIDSSIIAWIIEKELHRRGVKYFYIENKEDKYIQYISGLLEIEVQKIKLNQNAAKTAYYFNETPQDLGSVVPQYLLSREIAKEGINVCLSGDGADELFGGYSRMRHGQKSIYHDTFYHDVFIEIPFYHSPRLDKTMMANTIELRSPFLSKNMVEIGMFLNRKFRTDKKILRDTFISDMPLIMKREKKPLRAKVKNGKDGQFEQYFNSLQSNL